MTMPRRRSLASFAAVVTVALTLGGCASARSHAESDATAPSDAPSLAVSFENQAHDYVHVYLVGARRQWLLGRVEPGGRATLRIPEDALVENSRSVWLAVLAGEHTTSRVVGNPRAVTTTPEPVTTILSQRWTFTSTPATGQLTSLPVGRTRAGGP